MKFIDANSERRSLPRRQTQNDFKQPEAVKSTLNCATIRDAGDDSFSGGRINLYHLLLLCRRAIYRRLPMIGRDYIVHVRTVLGDLPSQHATRFASLACSVQLEFLVSESVQSRSLIIVLAAGLLVATLALFLLVLNLLLRPWLEHTMNRHMTNHRVCLGYAHFELLAGSLILRDLKIVQNAYPSPPIIHLTEARIGVQWLGLLHGQIMDCVITAPTLHLSAAQLKTEAATINLKEIKQELLKAPSLTIHRLRVLGFNSVYVDSTRSIEIEHVNLRAADLRRNTLYVPEPRGERGTIKMPELALSIAQAQISDAEIIYRNITPRKGYRAYLNDLFLHVSNISNLTSSKPARFELDALFMGSGRTSAAGQIPLFQPSRDLALSFGLRGLQLHSLNTMFRHYGHAEAAAGRLSVHSQLFVRDNKSSGFLELVIAGLQIQPAPDKSNPSVTHQIFHSAIKTTAKLLSIPQRSEPSRVDLSSTIDARSGLFGLLVQLAHKVLLEGFEPSFKHAAEQR